MKLQDAITLASTLAYEEDASQIVGMDGNNEWVIRHIEDPEEGMLQFRFQVNGDGIDINFALQVFSELEDAGVKLSDDLESLKAVTKAVASLG